MAEIARKTTRLDAFRRARGMTLEQLAGAVGRKQPQAQRWCAGATQPRKDAADQIVRLTHGLIHAGNYAELITEAEAKTMMAEFAARDARAGQVAS